MKQDYDKDIQPGERVRSYDFPDHAETLSGKQACYMEGVVQSVGEFDKFPDCDRYKILVERRVFRGKTVKLDAPLVVYPPVNGTPSTFGGVTHGVVRIR